MEGVTNYWSSIKLPVWLQPESGTIALLALPCRPYSLFYILSYVGPLLSQCSRSIGVLAVSLTLPSSSSSWGCCPCFPFACSLITRIAELCLLSFFSNPLKYQDFGWYFLDHLILNSKTLFFLFPCFNLFFFLSIACLFERVYILFIFSCFS